MTRMTPELWDEVDRRRAAGLPIMIDELWFDILDGLDDETRHELVEGTRTTAKDAIREGFEALDKRWSHPDWHPGIGLDFTGD